MLTWDRKRVALGVAAVVIVALVVPAVAAPLAPPAPDPYPRMAFVARNDIPFDALGIGAIAGAVGGVIAITPSDELSVAAATVLQEFEPDVVIIAGGPGAISEEVEADIETLGAWDVERAAGTTRDETAREIGRLIDAYGLGRPAMLSTSSGQNVGDLYLGGHFEAESATVGGTEVLPPRAWNVAVRDFDEITGTPVAQLGRIDFEVPADGGLIVVTASATATNEHASEEQGTTLLATLDHADFTDAPGFYAAAIGLASLDVGADTPGNQNTEIIVLHGAAPVDSGPHTVRVAGAHGPETHFQLPTVTVTWYPAGTAPATGLDVPTA